MYITAPGADQLGQRLEVPGAFFRDCQRGDDCQLRDHLLLHLQGGADARREGAGGQTGQLPSILRNGAVRTRSYWCGEFILYTSFDKSIFYIGTSLIPWYGVIML